MQTRFVRHFLFTLCLAIGPGLLAAETAPAKDGRKSADVAKPADAAKPANSPVSEPAIILPTVQVTAGRIRELDKEIARLDKLIIREKKKVKSSELDKTLNNAQLAHAAAIFGGNSSEHLSAVAASRVSLLETERSVLEAMKRPATVEDLAMLETELDQLRTTRRYLDDAAKQR